MGYEEEKDVGDTLSSLALLPRARQSNRIRDFKDPYTVKNDTNGTRARDGVVCKNHINNAASLTTDKSGPVYN